MPDEVGPEDDGLGSLGADAEDGGGGAGVVFDESYVGLDVFWEVFPGFGLGDVLIPTFEFGVEGGYFCPVFGGEGHVGEGLAIDLVFGGDFEGGDVDEGI